MKVVDISKDYALKIQTLLKELRPDWEITIIEEDINIYLLGFLNYISCSMVINVSGGEIDKLSRELTDLETAAFIDEEILYKSSPVLNEEEKQRKQFAAECMKRYDRYSCLQNFFVENTLVD